MKTFNTTEVTLSRIQAIDTSGADLASMKIPDANVLIDAYGRDRIKADSLSSPVHRIVDRICEGFNQWRGQLIPGRSQHDAKLRDMGLAQDAVRKSVQQFVDTGRFTGQMPDALPQPDAYSNAFTYLIALAEAVQVGCPDQTILKNTHMAPGYSYPEWQDFVTKQAGPVVTQFLSALAGASVSSSFGREGYMVPIRYRDWQAVGEQVYGLLFAVEGRADVLAASLIGKLDKLASPFLGHQAAVGSLEELSGTLLTKADALALVNAGWCALHREAIEQALSLSALYRSAHGIRPGTVSVAAIEYNLALLGTVSDHRRKMREAQAKADTEAEANTQAFEYRKKKAARKLELQGKLSDGTINSSELYELEAL